MPNWVYNTLTVEGDPETVHKMRDQLNQPFKQSIQANGDLAYSVKEINYSNPVFAFWNIIAPTDLEAYHKQPDFTADKPFAGDDWYNWNSNNWGVKWDVAVSDEDKYSSTELLQDVPNGENQVLVYRFDTPWGLPIFALEKLSAQYPTLLFTLSYEEETGWGGEDEFIKGEHIEGASWNWQCWECDYKETDEPPYCEDCQFDMCPNCGHGEPTDEDRATCQTHKVA